MKRTLAGLALTTAAALLTATPAHAAAPTDPAKALKRQLVAGKGVTFTDVTKINEGGHSLVYGRRTGTLQLAPSGPVAADITGKLAINASDIPEDAPEGMSGLAKPEHVIRIKNTSYISGGLVGEFLPEGKTWLKTTGGPGGLGMGMTGSISQIVNITEPGTLKALLATAKPSRGAYSGTITIGALNKVSPWFRASWPAKPTVKTAKAKITWKLGVDGRSLPQRLTVSYDGTALGVSGSPAKVIIDTRYTGWGAKAAIQAPPADQVTTKLSTEDGAVPEVPFLSGTGR